MNLSKIFICMTLLLVTMPHYAQAATINYLTFQRDYSQRAMDYLTSVFVNPTDLNGNLHASSPINEVLFLPPKEYVHPGLVLGAGDGTHGSLWWRNNAGIEYFADYDPTVVYVWWGPIKNGGGLSPTNDNRGVLVGNYGDSASAVSSSLLIEVHEIGHALGLSHGYAGSMMSRNSGNSPLHADQLATLGRSRPITLSGGKLIIQRLFVAETATPVTRAATPTILIAPVPLPSSLLFTGMGVAALALLKRRRGRKKKALAAPRVS